MDSSCTATGNFTIPPSTFFEVAIGGGLIIAPTAVLTNNGVLDLNDGGLINNGVVLNNQGGSIQRRPTAATQTFIVNNGTFTNDGVISDLTVNNSDTLINNGTISGPISTSSLENAGFNDGTITNNGSFMISTEYHNNSVIINNDFFQPTGTNPLHNNAGALFVNNVNANLDIAGNFRNEIGGIVNNLGTIQIGQFFVGELTNAGQGPTVECDPDGANCGVINNQGVIINETTFVNDGLVNNGCIGTITENQPIGPNAPVDACDAQAWTGGGGDDLWTNPLNWNSGRIPASTDQITLKNSAAVRFPGNFNFTLERVGSLYIDGGSSLLIEDQGNPSTLTNVGLLTVEGRLNSEGTIVNEPGGVVWVGGAGMGAATINNAGAIINDSIFVNFGFVNNGCFATITENQPIGPNSPVDTCSVGSIHWTGNGGDDLWTNPHGWSKPHDCLAL